MQLADERALPRRLGRRSSGIRRGCRYSEYRKGFLWSLRASASTDHRGAPGWRRACSAGGALGRRFAVDDAGRTRRQAGVCTCTARLRPSAPGRAETGRTRTASGRAPEACEIREVTGTRCSRQGSRSIFARRFERQRSGTVVPRVMAGVVAAPSARISAGSSRACGRCGGPTSTGRPAKAYVHVIVHSSAGEKRAGPVAGNRPLHERQTSPSRAFERGADLQRTGSYSQRLRLRGCSGSAPDDEGGLLSWGGPAHGLRDPETRSLPPPS